MAFDVSVSPIYSTHLGVVRLCGRFYPNGASAPTKFYGNWISSIAHASPGIYTITVKPAFRAAMSLLGSFLSLNVPVGGLATYRLAFGPIDLSAGTVVVHSYSDADGYYGAPILADIAAEASTFISVELVLKETALADGSGF